MTAQTCSEQGQQQQTCQSKWQKAHEASENILGESYEKLSVNYITRNEDRYYFLKSFGRT